MTANVVQWGKQYGSHPHPTIAKCLHCGKEYRTFPSYLKRRPGGGYCSKRCAGAAGAMGGQQPPRPRSMVTCATCGKTFPRCPAYAKRFAHNYCSRSCMGKGQTLYPPRPCAICGKIFRSRAISKRVLAATPNKGSYCSRACYGVSLTRRAQERKAATSL